MKLSVIIPTYKRFYTLSTCIDYLLKQTRKPDEIIIVDDNKVPESFVQSWGKELPNKGIRFQYHQKGPGYGKGACISRNIGVKESQHPYLLFLDDDIYLEKDYIEILMKKWSDWATYCPVGISGIVTNCRTYWFDRIYKWVFRYCGKDDKWDITDTGFPVWNYPTETHFGWYVNGGFLSIRKEAALEFPYRQPYPGRCPGDEIDLCWRVKNSKRTNPFLISPDLKAYHNPHASREPEYERGVKEGRTLVGMFLTYAKRDHKMIISAVLINKFLWSSFGWILRQVLLLRFRRAVGMIVGFCKETS